MVVLFCGVVEIARDGACKWMTMGEAEDRVVEGDNEQRVLDVLEWKA